jgi:hypothetical protein
VRHVIYALVDEIGTPRYVGQTAKLLSTRLSQHHSAARSGSRSLDTWLRSCPAASIIPLEVSPPDVDAAERKWIQQMRGGGVSLLNLYDGGRRSPTGQVHSQETRAAISAARTGKALSLEHRAKLSAAHKDVPLAPEHRAAIGRGASGRAHSPETRARLSEARKGDLNPMSRAKRAERARAERGGDAL